MQFIAALLKRLPFSLIFAAALGLIAGLLIGWQTKEFKDATPAHLRADLQEDYLRMAIESFRFNSNLGLAVDRWKGLGASANAVYERIQANPGGMDAEVIRIYGEAVRAVLESEGYQPEETADNSLSPVWRTGIIGVGVILLLGVVAATGMYMFRLFGRRGSGEVTAVMQAAEINRNVERTNFEKLGLAPPITQTMTTYVLGDDLYDESFSIDTPAGEFLGEYGVGVSEAIGVGEPKKVTAMEIWLFDKNDIKTATKVLMSQHAFSDPGLRARLEPKGELVLVEPQSQILLETATLQLLATVIDLEYGKGPLPEGSYFERITLELAIWPRQN